MKKKLDTWYKAGPKETFDGVKTIKNSIDDSLEINGKFGFIWRHSSTHYKACITSPIVANKHCKMEEKMGRGEEIVIKFPKSELKIWMARLVIKNNRTAMVERANTFSKGK